ncbi:MAG: cytochrome P460 family protein [Phycisphaerae bacterium]|jgi:cytochrome c553
MKSTSFRRWRRCAAAPLAAIAAAILTGCPSSGDGSAEAFFPENYRTAFTLVRDCRNSIEHAATVRVWVNAIGAQAYLNDANPLPVGTIVVKEQFSGAACDDDADLFLWSVMRKEEAGFDSQDGDWNWQDVSAPDRRVVVSGKTSCIGCHGRQECVERDYMCTAP